jgi:hypothetical protein
VRSEQIPRHAAIASRKPQPSAPAGVDCEQPRALSVNGKRHARGLIRQCSRTGASATTNPP